MEKKICIKRSQAASFSSCLRRLRRSSISSLEAPTSRSLFKSTLTSRSSKFSDLYPSCGCCIVVWSTISRMCISITPCMLAPIRIFGFRFFKESSVEETEHAEKLIHPALRAYFFWMFVVWSSGTWHFNQMLLEQLKRLQGNFKVSRTLVGLYSMKLSSNVSTSLCVSFSRFCDAELWRLVVFMYISRNILNTLKITMSSSHFVYCAS